MVQLCNSIAWSTATPRVLTVPSLTERIYVKDQGIDAEWDFEPSDPGFDEGPLIGRGWTVYQYKQRSVFARDRAALASKLKSNCKGALRDLIERTKRRPTFYVLFSNLDLTSNQKRDLKSAIRAGCPPGAAVRVEIVAAAELAALLNNAPHIRAAFFGTPVFTPWPQAWNEHLQESRATTEIPLIGRSEELALLKGLLSDPTIKAILVSGPTGVGKQRLILEATRDRSLATLLAPDPSELSAHVIRSLLSLGNEVIIIVEAEDRTQIDQCVREALRLDGLRVVVSTSSPQNAPGLGFGQDSKTRLVELKPISNQASEELFHASGARLDYSLESWVLEQCGGNPEMLLLAAKLGADLRKSDNFLEQLAAACRRDIERDLGREAVVALRALALFDPIGVTEDAEDLRFACSIIGGGITESLVLRLLPSLSRSGYLRSQREMAKVVPSLLANDLARSALLGRREAFFEKWQDLSLGARSRLARRLRRLPDMRGFWAAAKRHGHFLTSFNQAISEPELLLAAASAIPEDVSALIEQELDSLPVHRRRRIAGGSRRSLLDVLEELLLRRPSSRVALKAIGLLAAAENENYSNNATGIFSDSFFPLHSQLPLPLSERLSLLREFASPTMAFECQLLAISAIKTAATGRHSVPLRPSIGATPFDPQPQMHWEDVRLYLSDLADLLIEFFQSESPRVADEAAKALPTVAGNCLIQTGRDDALTRLQWVVNQSLTDARIPTSELIGSLQFAKARIDDGYASAEDAAMKGRLQGYSKAIVRLIATVEDSTVATRIRRWVGGWAWGDSLADDRKDEEAIRELARLAAAEPTKLDEDTFAWLNSEDARRSGEFFWELGREDDSAHWLRHLTNVQSTAQGAQNLANYVGGIATRDRASADRILDSLEGDERIEGDTLILTTQRTPSKNLSVDRILRLLTRTGVNPAVATTAPVWIAELDPDNCARLLEAVAGPNAERASHVVRALGMWLHKKRLLTEPILILSWRCLSTEVSVSFNDDWDFNRLASACAEHAPEAGFDLLERLLARPRGSGGWNPFRYLDSHEFWETLRSHDRRRAVLLILESDADYFTLEKIVDSEMDEDELLEFARFGEEEAARAASIMSADSPGFWKLAMKIVAAYPSSELVVAALERPVYASGGFVLGPYSSFLGGRRQQVDWLRSQPIDVVAVRTWLEKVSDDLRRTIDDLQSREAERELQFE